jgi:uncharacterized protein
MELSPFQYQGPLDPHEVRGRDDLVDDLVERVTARRVTALLGPRRYGKTSVLHKVAALLEESGTSVVLVDFYEVSSMADVVVRLDEALQQARGGARRRLDLLVSGELNLGLAKVMFARKPSQHPDPIALAHVLLDALVAAAAQEPTLVVFDEFAGIDRVDGAAGLLRTKLQAHVRSIGVLFAGSHTSLMRAMFTDRARPFYAQADLVEIEPLSATALRATVTDGFERTGRDPGSLASQIHEFTAGHPQRSMQLADAAWNAAEPGRPYSDELWGHALAQVRRQSAAANETLFSRSPASDQKLLRLVAQGKPLFGGGAAVLELSPSAVQASRDRLVDLGEILRRGSGWTLVDPVYADWIRHRFPV